MNEVRDCPDGVCPLRNRPEIAPLPIACATTTPDGICCSRETCRGMAIGALVVMILILVLTIIWFALDFSNTISQADDAWFGMGTFILAFIGIILVLVMEFKCTRCFICSS